MQRYTIFSGRFLQIWEVEESTNGKDWFLSVSLLVVMMESGGKRKTLLLFHACPMNVGLE